MSTAEVIANGLSMENVDGILASNQPFGRQSKDNKALTARDLPGAIGVDAF